MLHYVVKNDKNTIKLINNIEILVPARGKERD